MNVALLGLGTVGKAVFKILDEQNVSIFKDNEIKVKYVLVRNIENKNIDKRLLTTDYDVILEDKDVDVIIEMMGAKVSYDYIKSALNARKHVVTANKEVIAEHYVELQQIASEKNVQLLFEAAVGGGIPIVHTLLNSSQFNHIDRIDGILNGTTNYILTCMHNEKISFEEALKLAQEKGFAEADPTADLEGLDMVRKIAILSMICYESKINLSNVYHSGIKNVDKELIEVVELLGYRLKFVASSSLDDEGINLFVEPVILKTSDLLSNVDYEYNIVRYSGDGCASQMMYGKGAGPVTANSIVFDLGLLLAGYKQLFIPDNSYRCNGNKNVFSKYLVKADYLDSSLVEKRLGNVYITKLIPSSKINELKDDIVFYARIDE
jgi:homoserine dehydrogenase